MINVSLYTAEEFDSVTNQIDEIIGGGQTVALATQLATARTIRTNLASTSTASFDGSANITPGVTGTLPIANGGTGNTSGLAASATKLATARTIKLTGNTTGSATFNGTADCSITTTTSYATSAGSATKATQDASGNTITSYYVPQSSVYKKTSGTAAGYILYCSGDGVTEVGTYLDMHLPGDTSNDYAVRLEASSQGFFIMLNTNIVGKNFEIYDHNGNLIKEFL